MAEYLLSQNMAQSGKTTRRRREKPDAIVVKRFARSDK
jgi:hypothetical protein